MDDPDAMKAVGKVWVHWLEYYIKKMTRDECRTSSKGFGMGCWNW